MAENPPPTIERLFENVGSFEKEELLYVDLLESVSESIYTCKHQGESLYNLAEPVCYKLWKAADGRIFRIKRYSAIVHPSLILYVDALQVSLVNATFARCDFFELSAYKPRPVAHFKSAELGTKRPIPPWLWMAIPDSQACWILSSGCNTETIEICVLSPTLGTGKRYIVQPPSSSEFL